MERAEGTIPCAGQCRLRFSIDSVPQAAANTTRREVQIREI
jgi:hypothetical protein